MKKSLISMIMLLLCGHLLAQSNEYLKVVSVESDGGHRIQLTTAGKSKNKDEVRKNAIKSAFHTLFYTGVAGVNDGHPLITNENITYTKTFFDDNKDIPTALVSYVATAQRLGIIDGTLNGSSLVFEPNRGITKNEAAAIMSAILGISTGEEDGEYFDNATVSIGERASVLAMFTLGIFDGEISEYSGTDTVTRAEAAEYLYRI